MAGRSLADIDAQIDAASERRAAIWRGGPSDVGEVAKIGALLAELYEMRRTANAQVRDRADVIRRARVESELERLMSR